MSAYGIEVIWCDSIESWPGDLRPGALLLAMDATNLATAQIGAVAGRCLEGALAVVVCWGPGCERVHDTFDMTEVDMQIDGRRPQGSTVMTTWHADEPLQEAFEMLGWQVAFLEPPQPHVAVVVGEPDWLAQAEALKA